MHTGCRQKLEAGQIVANQAMQMVVTVFGLVINGRGVTNLYGAVRYRQPQWFTSTADSPDAGLAGRHSGVGAYRSIRCQRDRCDRLKRKR